MKLVKTPAGQQALKDRSAALAPPSLLRGAGTQRSEPFGRLNPDESLDRFPEQICPIHGRVGDIQSTFIKRIVNRDRRSHGMTSWK